MHGLVVGKNVAPMLADHWVNDDFVCGDSSRKVAKIEHIDEHERR